MTRSLLAAATVLAIAACAAPGAGQRMPPPTSLYDAAGRPVAYLVDDTIHLWSGRAVAYLVPAAPIAGAPERFDVYRFGGRHVGWLAGGIVRDRNGDGVCEVASMVAQRQPEPPRPARQPVPERILRDPAPLPPPFSRAWSDRDCASLLADPAN